MATKAIVATDDLADLRRGVLTSVLLLAGVVFYAWCCMLFFTGIGFRPIWYGPALLGMGLAGAMKMHTRYPSLAGATLILGILAADAYCIWLQGVRVAPYLLAIVISLTGLMFDLQAVLLMTGITGSLILAIGAGRWGHLPLSTELLAPALVVAAVGVLSAFSVRNLYTALYWAWERTQAAQRNEKELRERRGELVRTAKALDEACQRLEHLNYDLAQARAAADEARVLKQQFAATVSHELRTPLNVIVAFSEMMYMSPEGYGGVPLPPEYLGDVREIYRAGQHLQRLIDDVLELSQIQAQRLRLNLEPGSLQEVVSEALQIVRPLVRGKGIVLQAELAPELPVVLMDRARVRQVLLNLLNNARRFTQQGSICVRAACSGEQVQVTVADTGVGIAPGDHGKVFEEFRQLDASTTRQPDGTGLGLAISRHFVEMHGGRIWVESEGIPGQGSRFHFTLPLPGHEPPRAAGLQRTALRLSPPQGRGQSLLLLHGDPSVVRLLESRLETCRVVPTQLSEVSALVKTLRPRAVIVNSAPGRQAWRSLRQLRRLLPDCPVPVIMLPLVGEHQMGEALGVSDYLLKPVSRETLAAATDRLGRPLKRILVVDDDRRMAHVLSRMIRSTGRQCEVVRAYNGSSALLEMRRHPPDLVFLDLVMPGMDGRDVLDQMHRDAALSAIPVVVVTAQEHTPEVERQLGGDLLALSCGLGLTNQEAVDYLQRLLAAGMPAAALSQAGEAL